MGKRLLPLSIILVLLVFTLFGFGLFYLMNKSEVTKPQVLSEETKPVYWLLLHRKSNQEFLYQGVPGDKDRSHLLRQFKVKSGIPSERPTPLPKLLNKQYWIITSKYEDKENPETAPYFLNLDIPVSEEEPYGPTPYMECSGQCNWLLPGSFGLHGSGGDPEKISDTNPGSSGCIRHFDDDIAYLYNLLEPEKAEIRYYIEDI
jgi:hypothetical protein